MPYYYIGVHYCKAHPIRKIRMSGHIIKADCGTEAHLLRARHGISYPFHSNDIRHITVKRLDMRHKHNKDIINRRRKGIGGNIWYEDKKGKLRKEKREEEEMKDFLFELFHNCWDYRIRSFQITIDLQQWMFRFGWIYHFGFTFSFGPVIFNYWSKYVDHDN